VRRGAGVVAVHELANALVKREICTLLFSAQTEVLPEVINLAQLTKLESDVLVLQLQMVLD